MATYLPIKNEIDRCILIDDEDAPVLSRYHWYTPIDPKAIPRPYTWIQQEGKHPKTPRLARILTKAKRGQYVQHINGDPLDCRKENLRLVESQHESFRHVREAMYDRWMENPLTAPEWA